MSQRRAVKSRRSTNTFSHKVYARFDKSQIADIRQEANRRGLTPGEVVRNATMEGLKIISTRDFKLFETPKDYDGALEAIESSFDECMTKLNNRTKKPQQVIVAGGCDKKNRVCYINVDGLGFHLSFRI
jgi:hypothetical protein